MFDGLAGVFEERLVDKLGYRVPWQLFDVVYEVRVCEKRRGAKRRIDKNACTWKYGVQRRRAKRGVRAERGVSSSDIPYTRLLSSS